MFDGVLMVPAYPTLLPQPAVVMLVGLLKTPAPLTPTPFWPPYMTQWPPSKAVGCPCWLDKGPPALLLLLLTMTGATGVVAHADGLKPGFARPLSTA